MNNILVESNKLSIFVLLRHISMFELHIIAINAFLYNIYVKG